MLSSFCKLFNVVTDIIILIISKHLLRIYEVPLKNREITSQQFSAHISYDISKSASR
jgi:hypothetical protein